MVFVVSLHVIHNVAVFVMIVYIDVCLVSVYTATQIHSRRIGH